ncbi:hypothetical protein CFter6_5247 [Collimonas fungivorans]|uniref:Uncharacterized protein n=1 Tax=Collimonas fungivorans TaxID=158899 RepID=A0A127PJL3_9BURK|nr:hypothetical protein CFter6_5247 [Collimonas fungivorans]
MARSPSELDRQVTWRDSGRVTCFFHSSFIEVHDSAGQS